MEQMEECKKTGGLKTMNEKALKWSFITNICLIALIAVIVISYQKTIIDMTTDYEITYETMTDDFQGGDFIMALEKPSYRDNLERIKEKYPNKELLTTKDVADFCGIDIRTAKKRFDLTKNYISVATLARALS